MDVAGFKISKFYFGFQVHCGSWIEDSKAVDSGFYRPKLPGFRITLPWVDMVAMRDWHRKKPAVFL